MPVTNYFYRNGALNNASESSNRPLIRIIIYQPLTDQTLNQLLAQQKFQDLIFTIEKTPTATVITSYNIAHVDTLLNELTKTYWPNYTVVSATKIV